MIWRFSLTHLFIQLVLCLITSKGYAVNISPDKVCIIIMEEVLQKATDPEKWTIRRDSLLELSSLYEKEKELQKSFDYYKAYVILQDSMMNLENSEMLAISRLQHETEKKEKEIELLNKDKALHQTEFEKEKTKRNSFIVGFILVLLIGLMTYNRYRTRYKTNRQLSITLERLKNTQQQLVEQEKLASLGALTAGIAHEIKNPLNFINNFSELNAEIIEDLELASSDADRIKMVGYLKLNFQKISEHGIRADSIVKNMLAHSNNEKGEREMVKLNDFCDEYFRIAYKSMRVTHPDFKCELKTNLPVHVPSINLMSQDFSRVLLNIFGNAFYAVNEKSMGRTADGESGFRPQVSLLTDVSGSFITINIRDNGKGMPDKVIKKIFEPFFTTKPAGKGTGLGLSLSYDIVKAHNGEIKVISKEDEFTEFSILLPV